MSKPHAKYLPQWVSQPIEVETYTRTYCTNVLGALARLLSVMAAKDWLSAREIVYIVTGTKTSAQWVDWSPEKETADDKPAHEFIR